jgi:transcriptional regulator with XRE-family HTH domain
MNVINERQHPATPLPVKRALRKLGQDIRDARLRRRIPTSILAERASISRTTLYKVENGDANVSVGTYATVLFALGMIQRLSSLADATEDRLGRQLDEERLPKRIRLYRRKPVVPKIQGEL